MLWLCIRLPALRHEALAADEGEALERLCAWAYQWSSRVCSRRGDEMRPPLLWLELAASRALFGEPAALLARIERELRDMGYSHVCAIAPTPAAAALLTHSSARDGVSRCLLTHVALGEQLASLPLRLLALPLETRDALRSAGLACIGEVLAMPRAALARRFGPDCTHYLARLLGEVDDPQPSFRLPAVYRARCVFDYDLQDTQGLLFPLQRLLQEFQGYLRARDRAVLNFRLELEHVRRASGSREHSSSTLTIGLSTPAREAARFLTLVRERLQNLALSAPVSALTLAADAFTAPAVVQADLFGSETQQLGELTHLLDRLRARLGVEAVQELLLYADHRPERAFGSSPSATAMTRRVDAHTGSITAAITASPTNAARPGALLAPAQHIEAPTTLLTGPERIASGWWDGDDVVRDYYVARAADGSRQWVFHDLRENSWYLQGLWI
ncbi:MAG TPA: DNA polymerase Y family protein [Steroidobacteraceae bacterium]|nr:DNA polymerase Y family protein [Steroidobacteraceae bacterium]